jgi:hypothetical protein
VFLLKQVQNVKPNHMVRLLLKVRDGSLGLETSYGLDGAGLESQGSPEILLFFTPV